MKYLKKLRKSNEGVAGVMVALLLIGLFISVLALVQAVYVPQWMSQKEADHMDIVAAQFTDLKSTFDTLSVQQDTYWPISNPITLGSKEMPYLSSSRAYGILDFNPNSCKINIEDEEKNFTYSLGTLKYASQNSYYIDQSYIYESGALFLSQESKDLLVVKPAIFVTETNSLVINLISLSDNGKKCSASGYGTYPVQARFLSVEQLPFSTFDNITIYTSYKESWKKIFNESLPTSLFNFTIVNTPNDDGIIVQFSDHPYNYPLVVAEINLIEIEIQISHGWVE